jgi:hypothetical protein
MAFLIGWVSRWVVDFFANDIGNVDVEHAIRFALVSVSTYAVLNFVSVLINKNNFIITIDESSVSGPSNTSVWGSPKTLELQNIDGERLLQRTFWEKFWREKNIWSKDKQKIVVSRLFYSKEQEKEIIQHLLSLSNKFQEQQI